MSVVSHWGGLAAALAAPSLLVAQGEVVVHTKDATAVRGRLLQIVPSGVRIDPDGPATFLRVDAARIDSVRLVESGRMLRFPLAIENIPRGLPMADVPDPGDRAGFPTIALAGAVGWVGAGIPEEKEYYEGFSGGPTYQARVRLYLPDGDRRAPQLFLGVSYYHSTLRPEIGPADLASAGVEVGNLRVRHVGVELGGTTRMSRSESFGFVLFGVAHIRNEITARPSDGGVPNVKLEVSDPRWALRFEAGGVIGLTPRYGLLITGGGDFLIRGVERDALGQREPVTDGLLPSFSVGIIVDLRR